MRDFLSRKRRHLYNKKKRRVQHRGSKDADDGDGECKVVVLGFDFVVSSRGLMIYFLVSQKHHHVYNIQEEGVQQYRGSKDDGDVSFGVDHSYFCMY